MGQLLTVREVSDMINVHEKTVYQWISQGKIPHVRINRLVRFDEREIREWKDRGRKETNLCDLLPKFELSLENYDKMLLKERSALVKKPKRWSYGFGSIYIRRTKRGRECWYVDYRDENGSRRQELVRNAKSREEAMIALQERVFLTFSRQHGVKGRPERKEFNEFAETYLNDYAKVNKRSWKADRSYLKSLKSFFGGTYLDDISTLHVERYKAARLGQGVKKATVNRGLAILRRMLNLAKEWGFLEGDRGRIRLFPENDSLKERILSQEEEKALLRECCGHLKPIVKTALETGMRRGEILNLRWSQVDLKNRTIKVERTKSGRTRYVAINSSLAKELASLKKTGSVYVFANPETGRPYADVKRAFKGACRRAGIRGLRFHDLRHTFATRLVERGVDLITVKELLGHSTVKITERYTHSDRDRKREAVESLSFEKPGKRSDPLRIRDTGKPGEKDDWPFPFFSVN